MKIVARVEKSKTLKGYLLEKNEKIEICSIKNAVMLAKAGLIDNGIVVTRKCRGREMEYVRAKPGYKFGEYCLDDR